MGLPSRTVRALTICQPWAWAILHAGKNLENRGWGTGYRGALLIHAGKSRAWLDAIEWLRRVGFDCPDADGLDFGAIVGQVDQIGCDRIEVHRASVWASGPWCHVYRSPRAFERPINWRGAQGFFGVPLSAVPEFLRLEA